MRAGKDSKKPLMLLLHGFPELWFSWRNQLEEFREDFEVCTGSLGPLAS